MVAWADLPSGLLNSISDCLDILSCISISAVCTNWASNVHPNLPTLPPFRLDQPIPWLLLSVGTSKDKPDHTDFTFYDLTTATSYCISSTITFSSIYCPRWLGSNSGWLVLINLQFQLHLISPLTGAQICPPYVKLPHGYQGNLTNYWDTHQNALVRHSYEKVIIYRVPDHGSGSDTGLFLPSLFWPQGLAVLKIGDDKWTWLDFERHYKDVIIYRGRIYAMADYTLYCWELKGSSFEERKVLTVEYSMWIGQKNYPVESEGKILMICKNWDWDNGGYTMSVYKLDLDQRYKPLSSKSIGDNAVFMGLGNSRVASTVGLDSARGNCIYYVDDEYTITKSSIRDLLRMIQEFTISRRELMSISLWPRPGFGLVISDSVCLSGIFIN